jgi:hypothetical protein
METPVSRTVRFSLIISVALLLTQSVHAQWAAAPEAPPINGLAAPCPITGLNIPRRDAPSRTPGVYTGWLFQRDGVEFDLSAQGTAIGGLEGLSHSYNPNGLWLGASHHFQPGAGVGLYVGAWFLIDQGAQSTETYTTIPELEDQWSVNTDKRLADAAMTINIGGPFDALGGFRFDYLSSGFYDRELAPQTITEGTEAQAVSYAYLPYMGLQFRRLTNMGALMVKVIGSPFYPGNFNYEESINPDVRIISSGDYSKGYILETDFEFSRIFFGSADFGGFFNWRLAHSQADLNLSATGFGAGPYELNMKENLWSAGMRLCFALAGW